MAMEKDTSGQSYRSMEAVIAKNNRKPDGPKIIICPVCHKRGRVNDFHPDKARPDLVDYVVVHEKLRGAWGKNKAVRKRRRCYITKLIDREAILKKLGRYIPPTNNLERYMRNDEKGNAFLGAHPSLC